MKQNENTNTKPSNNNDMVDVSKINNKSDENILSNSNNRFKEKQSNGNITSVIWC